MLERLCLNTIVREPIKYKDDNSITQMGIDLLFTSHRMFDIVFFHDLCNLISSFLENITIFLFLPLQFPFYFFHRRFVCPLFGMEYIKELYFSIVIYGLSLWFDKFFDTVYIFINLPHELFL